METITNFANDNITEIRNCFDCFTIASMPNPSGTDNILTDERFKQLQDAYDEQAQDIKSVLVSYEALKDSIQWSVFEEKQGALKAALQDMIEQSEEDPIKAKKAAMNGNTPMANTSSKFISN